LPFGGLVFNFSYRALSRKPLMAVSLLFPWMFSVQPCKVYAEVRPTAPSSFPLKLGLAFAFPTHLHAFRVFRLLAFMVSRAHWLLTFRLRKTPTLNWSFTPPRRGSGRGVPSSSCATHFSPSCREFTRAAAQPPLGQDCFHPHFDSFAPCGPPVFFLDSP